MTKGYTISSRYRTTNQQMDYEDAIAAKRAEFAALVDVDVDVDVMVHVWRLEQHTGKTLRFWGRLPWHDDHEVPTNIPRRQDYPCLCVIDALGNPDNVLTCNTWDELGDRLADLIEAIDALALRPDTEECQNCDFLKRLQA